MQDRFKFRVWDKENFNYLEFEGFKKCEIEFNFDIDTNSIWIEFDKKKYDVLQCTGLKDKNGKLIYEGDIIQIPDDYDTYGMFACEKREIYFNEGGFRLKPKWDKNSRGNWLEDTEDFEVIGNIYENPELIGGAECTQN